jgi:hypothetical protein
MWLKELVDRAEAMMGGRLLLLAILAAIGKPVRKLRQADVAIRTNHFLSLA